MTADHLPPWERIVANLGDALIFIDCSGRIGVWNDAAQALFGFTAAQALGQHVNLIIPAHLQAAHARGFERAMQRGACSRPGEIRTTRGVHQDGRKLYVEMSFSVVTDGAGQVLGSAAMARDVTERYLAQKNQV